MVRLELVRTGSPAARVNIDPLDAVIPEHWPREGCCYRRGLRDQVELADDRSSSISPSAVAIS